MVKSRLFEAPRPSSHYPSRKKDALPCDGAGSQTPARPPDGLRVHGIDCSHICHSRTPVPAQLRLAAASGIRASGAIRNVLGRQASDHGCQGSRGPSGLPSGPPPTSPSSFCRPQRPARPHADPRDWDELLSWMNNRNDSLRLSLCNLISWSGWRRGGVLPYLAGRRLAHSAVLGLGRPRERTEPCDLKLN